jgi:undecaprenyldiphospho-muramoylpentapeptide beta-N-acetylglucosaminyltransferase
MRRLLVAGGGTGGHVYPLLAVLETLHEHEGEVEVHYLGRSQSVEERLAREHNLEFRAIPAGGIRGLGPWRVVTNLSKLAVGLRGAVREVRDFGPDAVFVTGGYVSVPAALAAWLARRPVVVCLPDMAPGLAVRLLARLATSVTVSFEEVVPSLPANKAVVTGYPVRQALLRGDREQARRRLGIAASECMLVVLGGSSGARSINEAVLAALPDLLALAQVFHLTGTLDYERVRARREQLDTCVRQRCRIYSFVEEELADMLWAADLVVARAGAATLGEFPAVGVPSVLVPGRFAGGHQALNATYLKDRGAALVIEDDDLRERLLPTVRELLEDRERLAAMAEAARSLARPQACGAIVAELRRAADQHPQ